MAEGNTANKNKLCRVAHVTRYTGKKRENGEVEGKCVCGEESQQKSLPGRKFACPVCRFGETLLSAKDYAKKNKWGKRKKNQYGRQAKEKERAR